MIRKFILSIFILSISLPSICQNYRSKLIGSWVKVNATYRSGEELPLNHALNQSYFRFDFKSNSKVFKSVDPLDNGYIFDYSIIGHNLKIGFINYKVDYLTNDTLVLIEEGRNGFDDFAVKFFLVPEKQYQNRISLTLEMIIKVGKDSVFIESEKIRACFNKDESFHEFLRNNIAEYSNVVSSDNFFMATFIINSNGLIDSINIFKGINKAFDSQFVKAVNKSSKYWIPAKLENKDVSVLHTETFNFISNPKFEKQYYNYRDGVIAMQQGDYNKAIGLFNICLESDPEDKNALYQRGICYYKLDNLENACNDWRKIKELKSNMADNLIIEICK
jgi:hypothetical protein